MISSARVSRPSLVSALRAERVLDRLNQLGAIGAVPEGGITRLAYNPAWREAAHLIRAWMEDAGLEVTQTPIGTLTGLLPGRQPGEAAVISGSHFDSVRNGGIYDGALGVLATIEALQAIQAVGGTERSLIAIAFAAEESARFPGAGLFASKVMSGAPVDDALLRMLDSEGVSLAEAISSQFDATLAQPEPDPLAIARSAVAHSIYPMEQIAAFIELHIEQSPQLDQTGCPIGIVERVAGVVRLKIDVHGEQAHSGTTTMGSRHDALAAAAELVLLIEDHCSRFGTAAVGTVGNLRAYPGSINTVPGRAELLVDIRSPHTNILHDLMTNIQAAVQSMADRRNVTCQIHVLSRQEPLDLDANLVNLIEQATHQLGVPSQRMPSLAAHDAMQLARAGCRAGMIFVPSVAGVSHAPHEYTAAADIVQGVIVLTQTLYELASDAAMLKER